MKSSLGLLALVVASLLSHGCKAALRAPVCTDREMELPEGAEGRYRMSVTTQSVAHSGALVALGEIEFVIKAAPDGLEVSVYGENPTAARTAFSSLLAGRMRSLQDDTMTPWMQLDVCRIGDTYYQQEFDEETGTYSVSRFDLSPTGITTAGLVWSPEELKAAGYLFHYLPQLEEFSDGKWTFDAVEPARMIVDNVGLSPERRAKLVELAHTSSIGMVLSRVPEPSSFAKSGRPIATIKLKSAARL